jgi:hypothetical protein
MKLIEIMATKRQIKMIPKSDIPNVLGELETLKARLWVRFMEWEEMEPVVVLAKTVKQKRRSSENPVPAHARFA